MRFGLTVPLLGLILLTPLAGQNLLAHPSFDSGLAGWDSFWSRDQGQGSVEAVGDLGAKIMHQGTHDWSFSNSVRPPVQTSEAYQFSARVKRVSGQGTIQLSVVLREGDRVVDWLYGVRTVSQAADWTVVTGRFAVGPGVTSIQFRFTGEGASSWLVDDASLARTRTALAPVITQPVTISSPGLSLVLDPAARRLRLVTPTSSFEFDASLLLGSVTAVKAAAGRIDLTLADATGGSLAAALTVADGSALLTINGGDLDADVSFPGPLLAAPGQSWILPLNEGLLVPSDLPPALNHQEWVLYGGHGLCMPFVGLTDGTSSLLALAETPDDARVRLGGEAGSTLDFVWQPSRAQWRYERRLRLVPVTGGYVEVAKAYREYAAGKGLVVTLKKKAAQVPQVDKLVGAVDLWYWKDAPRWTRDDTGAAAFGSELKSLGIDRVLWSAEEPGPVVGQLNALGFLTGRYDIYQDVWGPDNPSPWVNHDGWPDDLVLEPDGRRMSGWVDRYGGRDYPGGVISSARSLGWEQKRVSADMKTHAYGARFLDTVTASPLREDWNPAHPLSRSDDRANKLEMLAWLSRDQHLVVGSETGFDFAVPALHYFEGMMSIAPFRLPDSGYDLTSAKVPSQEFKDFQLGPKYRIPLFELVYHGCVVSYWYWGDSSNRVPEQWDERDIFNALYGTGPLWIVDPATWSKYKTRFVQSFRSASVSRQTGYSEMTAHVMVTADQTVQRSTFADGTVVTANFGSKPWTEAGVTVKPRGYRAVFPDGSVVEP